MIAAPVFQWRHLYKPIKKTMQQTDTIEATFVPNFANGEVGFYQHFTGESNPELV